MSGNLDALPAARLVAVRHNRTSGGTAVYFELKSLATGELIDGASGVSARFWFPGAAYAEASANPVTPVPVGPGVWMVLVPYSAGSTTLQMSITSPVAQTAESVFDPSTLAPADTQGARQMDATRETSAIVAADTTQALVAQEIDRLSQTVEDGLLPVATAALLSTIPVAREGQRAEVYADPPAPALTNPDGSNRNGIYRGSLAGQTWAYDGPSSRALDARTQQQQQALTAAQQEVAAQGEAISEQAVAVKALVDTVRESSDALPIAGHEALFGVQDDLDRIMPVVDKAGRVLQARTDGTVERIPLKADTDADIATNVAAETNARTAQIETIGNIVVDGRLIAHAVRDPDGRISPVLDGSGRHVQVMPDGTVDSIPYRSDVVEISTVLVNGETVPMIPLIGGERPWRIQIDPDGRVVEAWTLEGGHWLAGPDGLVRASNTESVQEVAPSYTLLNADAGFSVSTNQQIWRIRLIGGQSNGEGQNAFDDTLLATTARYPTQAFMLGSSPRVTGVSVNQLNPLVEVVQGTQRETGASGWINHSLARIAAYGGGLSPHIGIVHAVGGQRIHQLRRGTTSWRRMLVAVQDATRLVRAAGGIPVCDVHNYVGNETDITGDSSAPFYAAALQQYQRQLSEDIKAITGQREEVILMVTMVSQNVQNVMDAFHHRVYEAYQMMDGHPYIRFSGGMYHLPIQPDGLHITSIAQNRRGQQVARASDAEIYGSGWSHMRPIKHWWTGPTTLDVQMHVPFRGNLVWDTSGVDVTVAGIQGYGGIQFSDGTATPPTITGHSIVQVFPGTSVQQDVLRLTLSSPPGGFGSCTLSGGIKTAADRENGPVIGGRTLLHGSVQDINLYDGHVDYDWCPPFIRSVGRP